MVNKQEIQRLLKEYFKIYGKTTIHDSGVVNVIGGDVILIKKNRNTSC